MEKKMVWRKLEQPLDFDGELGVVIARLTTVLLDNSEYKVRIRTDYTYDGDYLVLEYEDLETDEERKQRVEREKYDNERRNKYDREMYENLKKKFEVTP